MCSSWVCHPSCKYSLCPVKINPHSQPVQTGIFLHTLLNGAWKSIFSARKCHQQLYGSVTTFWFLRQVKKNHLPYWLRKCMQPEIVLDPCTSPEMTNRPLVIDWVRMGRLSVLPINTKIMDLSASPWAILYQYFCPTSSKLLMKYCCLVIELYHSCDCRFLLTLPRMASLSAPC